jgi:hypothetical protein
MIPAAFDYVRPANLDETLRILTDREGEAKLLSGGYSLLPLLKLRLAQPALLVDLQDVAGLDSSTMRLAGSATHRSATGERSVGRAPTPIPRRTGRPSSSPRVPRSSVAVPRASG